MNKEQIDRLKQQLANVKAIVAEIESILDDAEKCGSDVSKKLLYTGAVRQFATIPELFVKQA